MASSPSWLMTYWWHLSTGCSCMTLIDIVSMWSWVLWSPTPGNRSPSSWEQTAEVTTSRLRGRWARYGTELNLMHDILMCRLLCICIYIHTHTYIYISHIWMGIIAQFVKLHGCRLSPPFAIVLSRLVLTGWPGWSHAVPMVPQTDLRYSDTNNIYI
jgi:hypothetical protein